jgi:hypothetical protein
MTSPLEPAPPTADDPLWLRIFFIIILAFLAYFVFWIAIVTGIIQLAAKLVSQDINPELDRINKNLADYMRECIAYITFAADEKPFPFRSGE